MEKLKFDLTLEESNLILKALGEMPYIQVVGLIQTIRKQAESQLYSLPENDKNESGAESKTNHQKNGKAAVV